MVATLDQFTGVQPDRQMYNPRNGRWVYFRLGKRFGHRNGWIVPAQAHDEAMGHNTMKGMAPLYEFGTFFDEQPGWILTTDPYRRILEKGGAHEFPVSQVIELGWHRDPPLVNGQPVAFPQVERDADGNVVLERGRDGTPARVHRDHVCQHCGAVRKSEVGLRKHEASAHKDIAQTDQLARSMAHATQATAVQTADQMAAAIRALSEGQQALARQIAEQQAVTNELLARFLAGGNQHRQGQRAA